MTTKAHLEVLKQASAKGLPTEIDELTYKLFAPVCELIDGGYLQGIDASTMEGKSYMHCKITLKGREYLQSLEKDLWKDSLAGRSVGAGYSLGVWVVGILAAVIATVIAGVLMYCCSIPAK
ncbi:MAG: hypothetical protein ACO1RA_06665 [Planctomycetaceae bacterium]